MGAPDLLLGVRLSSSVPRSFIRIAPMMRRVIRFFMAEVEQARKR
jgi:hypothetical protein